MYQELVCLVLSDKPIFDSSCNNSNTVSMCSNAPGLQRILVIFVPIIIIEAYFTILVIEAFFII